MVGAGQEGAAALRDTQMTSHQCPGSFVHNLDDRTKNAGGSQDSQHMSVRAEWWYKKRRVAENGCVVPSLAFPGRLGDSFTVVRSPTPPEVMSSVLS